MKILMAVPTFETINPSTFKSIYGLTNYGHAIDFDFIKGYDCAKARNEIARRAINRNYDFVLMVDSDIILPSDALVLLANPLVDICLGVYPRKQTVTGQTELFLPGYDDFTDENNISMHEIKACGQPRIEVKGGGMGCAFIDVNVLKSMQFPWFSYVTYPSGAVLSEDLDFCCKASEQGFRIFADTRVRCGHINTVARFE